MEEASREGGGRGGLIVVVVIVIAELLLESDGKRIVVAVLFVPPSPSTTTPKLLATLVFVEHAHPADAATVFPRHQLRWEGIVAIVFLTSLLHSSAKNRIRRSSSE